MDLIAPFRTAPGKQRPRWHFLSLGAALIARTDPDATIVVMPADHAIEPAQEFRRAVHAAEQLCDEFPTALITFGIPPAYPATGYGYIHRGAPVAQRQGIHAYRVRQFREKPSAEVAEHYLAAEALPSGSTKP